MSPSELTLRPTCPPIENSVRCPPSACVDLLSAPAAGMEFQPLVNRGLLIPL